MPRHVASPPTPAPLSPARARLLTDRFKTRQAALWRELVCLHDGGAHTALDYSSWHAYCEAEFGIGRSHSYRLLEAGRVTQLIPQLGNEAHARPLVRLLREQGDGAVREVYREVQRRQGDRATAADYNHAVAAKLVPVITSSTDRAPHQRTISRSREGEIYQLGPHRLICGDATDPEVLARLLDGERASMICTDPPYGVDYVGRTADQRTIANDTEEDLERTLLPAWQAATPLLIESAPFYVAGPTGPTAERFYASIREARWRMNVPLIWVKNRATLGRQDYQVQHEAIYVGYTSGRPAGRMRTPNRHLWYGPDNATTVITGIASPAASREHPTMKPVELLIPFLQHSCRPGEIVLDQFAGSGSTMVAAHHTQRRAYLCELDPLYCDLIRRRWNETTS
jgi:site-specific DNA-methyltransferase (adenine-specific)